MAYDAFISYSHAADQPLARALDHGLQQFAKPWFKRRAMNVFLDEGNLNLSPHLWSSIVQALDAATFLICLASPAAAASPWVAREIDHWKTNRERSRLILVLTDGELAWDAARRDFDPDRSTAISPALHGAFDEEPLYLDLRWARGADLSLANGRFKAQVVQLAAAVRGVPVEDLIGDELEQHRRTVRIRNLAITGLASLAVAATIAAVMAVRNASEAARQQGLAEDAATDARSQQRAAEASAREAASQRDRALSEVISARAKSLPANSTPALLLAIEAVRKAAAAGSDRAADAEGVLLSAAAALPGQGLAVYQGPFQRQTNMETWLRFDAGSRSVLVGNMVVPKGAMRYDLTSAHPGVHRTWVPEAVAPSVMAQATQSATSPDQRWRVVPRDDYGREFGLVDRAPGASPGRFVKRITAVAWAPDGSLFTEHPSGVNCGGCPQERQWQRRWSRGTGLEARTEAVTVLPDGAVATAWGLSLWRALGLEDGFAVERHEPPSRVAAVPSDLVEAVTVADASAGSFATGSVVAPDGRWGLIRISYAGYAPCGYGQTLRLVSIGGGAKAPSTIVTVWENGARDRQGSVVRTPPLDLDPSENGCVTEGFSPDGAWLAAGTTLWHLRDSRVGAKAIQLPGEFIAFDPGSRFVVVQRLVKGARPSGALLFVPLDPAELIEVACRSAGRNLDYLEWNEYFPGEPYRRICADLPLPWVDQADMQ